VLVKNQSVLTEYDGRRWKLSGAGGDVGPGGASGRWPVAAPCSAYWTHRSFWPPPFENPPSASGGPCRAARFFGKLRAGRRYVNVLCRSYYDGTRGPK